MKTNNFLNKAFDIAKDKESNIGVTRRLLEKYKPSKGITSIDAKGKRLDQNKAA